ncbi:MAG: hypothetical protein DWQ06_13830 [Calditrichaeota bacterium]|nr:MAG: hypothetical protein DWQ06_13830 [Calditrichota bacterium]
MKNFEVYLTRTYKVEVKTESEEKARGIAEHFLSNCKDNSNQKSREEFGFEIGEIELVLNEATESHEIIEKEKEF